VTGPPGQQGPTEDRAVVAVGPGRPPRQPVAGWAEASGDARGARRNAADLAYLGRCPALW